MARPSPWPQCVTRFYGNIEYALDVIKNQQITFVHTSMLNDPFDPYLFFETDFGENRARMIKYIRSNHPAEERHFREVISPETWQKAMALAKSNLLQHQRDTFVFSTSAECGDMHPRNNLYMWGHYGNGHRGVAIEFDVEALAKSLVKLHSQVNPTPIALQDVWSRIEYREKFAPITCEMFYDFLQQEVDFATGKILARRATAFESYFDLMVRVKSDAWSQENEWRLMWRFDEAPSAIWQCPISKESITSITLGLRTEPCIRDSIIATSNARFPNASVRLAKKRHGDLSLDFV
jgi:hypothetical protein